MTPELLWIQKLKEKLYIRDWFLRNERIERAAIERVRWETYEEIKEMFKEFAWSQGFTVMQIIAHINSLQEDGAEDDLKSIRTKEL